MGKNVVNAVFKRNFVSYFTNPTGYVFICVFVWMIAYFTFWPDEFFAANLANLDQLNKYVPLVMLVFIPAITMSIWAEERRQGTDELLLTIPVADFDVVLGKYLAAVAIFTVALLFSAMANFLVFILQLGMPDIGLYVGSYLGYWLMGLAMLAIGMVASFLTANLTVGFILGALFNAPLVGTSLIDAITIPVPGPLVSVIGKEIRFDPSAWSLGEKFRDLGQGVISLTSVSYFILIIVVGLYLSMVLIGRRHWMGGKNGTSMLGHYLVRAVALMVLVFGINLLISRVSFLSAARLDVTAAQLSSLSPQTKKLIRELDTKYPVQIDAYISPEVPETYVQARVNLINALREFDALGGDKVRLTIHTTEPLSDEAANADQQWGIKGQQVPSRERGTMRVDQIFMGVAMTCGPVERVIIPFIDRGVPAEYELVRSIATVAQQKRKTVGVLITDARLMGGFNQATMGMSRGEAIIDELSKQYEVKEVRADQPITDKYDVLLAVQPSSLGPDQMPNFLAAVKNGQPTAIFEDPFPFIDRNVPGTKDEKQPAGGNPMMRMFGGGGGPPPPKGNIAPLWNMLGVDFQDAHVVWQNWNPYPSIATFPPEFVFTGVGSGNARPFNDKDSVSSDLQQMLFVFPGSVRHKEASSLTFTELVLTGKGTGTVATGEILEPAFFGQGGGLNRNRKLVPQGKEYVLACHIKGKLKEDLPMADDNPPSENAAAGTEEKKTEDAAPTHTPGEINVILVADIDVLYSAFFNLRAQGEDEEADVNLSVDNVTFVLNALDKLAGDERFLEIRKRRPAHQTLTIFEKTMETARNKRTEATDKFRAQFEADREKEQAKFDKEIADLEAKRSSMDAEELLQRLRIAQTTGQKRLQATTERLERERDKQIEKAMLEFTTENRRTQNSVKRSAVIWPPILPLMMGVIMFFNRRAREREGVSKARLR